MEQELILDREVFVVRDFLTRAECKAFIEETEEEEYGAAPITTARGPVMAPSIRNNERVMLDRDDWAEWLWERMGEIDLPWIDGLEPIGINERFRFYRYGPGQRFAPHYDGCWQTPDGRERSYLTMMVYLNDGFEGGQTAFLDYGVEVEPQLGMALFFIHELHHEGVEVDRGRKYVLRTDVMYDIS